MAGGYAGKFLRVDLSKGSWDDFTIADDVLRQYIGGSCLAAKLFLERYPIEADPLSPENPLMIMTGPMVGSGFPGTSRFSVCAKSPQTGIWAESACGGTFGPELKRAGYDGIVIEGRSEKPVVLSIIDSKIALSDASSLWGKDIYEATDELKAADRSIKALVIGPAGENLARIAAIGNDKGHFSGRAGLGAVMGSKNLKAVLVKGNAGKAPKADDDAFKTAMKAAMQEIKESALADGLLADRHRVGVEAAADLTVQPAPDTLPDDAVALLDALARMPTADRRLLVLALVGGVDAATIGRVVGARLDLSEIVAHGICGVPRQIVDRHLGIPQDADQDVVKVMCNATGNLSQGAHPLRLNQCLLSADALRDICDEQHHVRLPVELDAGAAGRTAGAGDSCKSQKMLAFF